MKSSSKKRRVELATTHAFLFARHLSRPLPVRAALLLILPGGSLVASAQKTRARKLPSPDKIVSDYLKAVGGRARQNAVRDATKV